MKRTSSLAFHAISSLPFFRKRAVPVSSRDAEIIKASFGDEEGLDMILPFRGNGLDDYLNRHREICRLVNVRRAIEMDRCFDTIEFQEIPAPVPWNRVTIACNPLEL
jgi:hypothetical protein